MDILPLRNQLDMEEPDVERARRLAIDEIVGNLVHTLNTEKSTSDFSILCMGRPDRKT
jgi:hypothetical protein